MSANNCNGPIPVSEIKLYLTATVITGLCSIYAFKIGFQHSLL